VGELLYDFDADQQDRFVRNADALDPTQADRLQRYELTPGDLLDLYPFKLRDLRKLPTLLRHFRG
jgi:digeranylgeranylglycerophospholipid reductase